MPIKPTLLTILSIFLFGCTTSVVKPDLADLQQQVMETERAFAQTMVDRDFEAFKSFLSNEAVFFSGAASLQGKQQVADTWKAYYETKDAPFSWEPEQVVVLESGKLALSTGPVRDSEGKLVATFNSIWQRDPDGGWHIVFDKGNDVCE
jgi:ketosteroid isomerase-like protein